MYADFGKGDVAELNLSSLRQTAATSEKEAEHVIKTIVDTREEIEKVGKTLENWDTAKSHIYPLPKMNNSICDIKGKEVLNRKVAGDIVLTFVFDAGDRFAFLSEKNLKTWNKDLYDVEKTAIENLQKSNTDWKFVGKNNRGYIVAKEGKDAMPCTSILSIPNKVRALLDKNGFKNKKVLLTAPYQDLILVCEASAENFMKSAATAMIAHQTTNMARPITTTPILIDENGALSDYKDNKIPTGIAMLGQIDKKTGKTKMIGNIDLRNTQPAKDDDFKNYIG